MQLTEQQIKKANKLLDLLCKSDIVGSVNLYPLFDSIIEAESICLILEENGLLHIIHVSGDKKIHCVRKNDKTCIYAKNNLLSKELRKDRKSIFSGNLTIISLIVSLILNIVLIGNLFLKSDDPSKSKANLDACMIRESKLNHVVDSLSLQNHNLQDKVITLETEIMQLKQKVQN